MSIQLFLAQRASKQDSYQVIQATASRLAHQPKLLQFVCILSFLRIRQAVWSWYLSTLRSYSLEYRS